MFFTQEDFRKIEEYLKHNSQRDGDFPSSSPLKDEDYVAIVQEGKNTKLSLANLFLSELFKAYFDQYQKPLGDELNDYNQESIKRDTDIIDMIKSIEIGGLLVMQEFGDSTQLGISQKTLTDAINKIWQKLEDITGEVLQGISMTVTPEYFISEEGCNVHISATPVEPNGTFEHVAFYVNGTLLTEAENVGTFEYDTEITETSVIKCEAKILGVEYDRQQVITHYNSFWLGAGSTYTDVMDVEHVIPITNGMRGAYNIDVAQGQHIIIVIGESLASGFLRADLNSVEIPFTESTVTVDDKNYKVFVSDNAWSEGTYNIDING